MDQWPLNTPQATDVDQQDAQARTSNGRGAGILIIILNVSRGYKIEVTIITIHNDVCRI